MIRRCLFANGPVVLLGLLALAGCSDGGGSARSGSEELEPGGIDGELEARVVKFRNGTSETRYLLRLSDGRTQRLLFTKRPRVAPGTPLTVWGSQGSEGIHVDAFAVRAPAGDLGSSASPLVGGPVKKARKMALVLVDLGKGMGDMTVEKGKAALLGNGDLKDPNNTSVARYFYENSYGEQSYSGDVVGPLKYTLSSCSDDAMDEMASALRTQIPTKYDQYAWYFPEIDACDWSGLGSSGSPTRPAKDTWYNGALDCVVFVQEPGHNYGMYHSSGIDCGNVPFVDAPNGNCSHDEYGDNFDPMGNGCFHMNMWQKEYVGWLGGCNSVKVTASGTFDIFPVSTACNAIQVLQIPMPKTRNFAYDADVSSDSDKLAYYYVEYRYERPFDDPGIALFQGVLVHVAPAYVPQTEDGLHTHILNMQPTVRGDHPNLPAGKSFVDPAGSPTITVVSANATKATIKVEFEGGGSGMPTCLDGTTLTAPGPQSCGNDDTGSGGAAGSGGASGGAGSGGSGGSAGAGGSFTGTPGTGGATGSGGSSSQGGGAAGHAGATGGGGATGGAAGHAGALLQDQPGGAPEMVGTCSCRAVGVSSTASIANAWRAAPALGLIGVLLRRRRASRRAPRR
jgi:uncharacterized membrane protein YgcG